MNRITDRRFLMNILKTVLFLFLTVVLMIWAWNNAVTTIFGLPVIHFKEALGILILAFGVSMLFKPGSPQTKYLEGNKS